MSGNTLPCGGCANLSPTLSTRERATRPVGYCFIHMTLKLRGEVVPECAHAIPAKLASRPGKQA